MLNFTPSPSFEYSPVPQNPPVELLRTSLTSGVKTEIVDPVTKAPVIQLNPRTTLNEKANLFVTQFRDSNGSVRLQLPSQQIVRVYEQSSNRIHAVATLGTNAPAADRIDAEIAQSNSQTNSRVQSRADTGAIETQATSSSATTTATTTAATSQTVTAQATVPQTTTAAGTSAAVGTGTTTVAIAV